ncbi:MAG: hypothetical protein HOE35_00215 [Candidatus Ruthia sp.]|mgnify:CR=1 FL=1|jgi:hypothetical protein|nr:hypothetical protein [Candidatus Ruthturnera sp.]MBT4122340.1 hypothetical protein [Candidatus Ruthturnera sp.]MBT4668512.1 hypothetical protein [Candidatus Ruthturnera sp.]MBT6922894.1 hypothetical protein [Candidatus Ruthturnera sp.]
MKPDTTTAMYELIAQIKDTLPFDDVGADFCSDTCSGCSLKLIDFIALEVDEWEYRLKQHKVPNFNDINKLANMAKKIHTVLIKNNLI